MSGDKQDWWRPASGPRRGGAPSGNPGGAPGGWDGQLGQRRGSAGGLEHGGHGGHGHLAQRSTPQPRASAPSSWRRSGLAGPLAKPPSFEAWAQPFRMQSPFEGGTSQAQISIWKRAVDTWFQEAADEDGWVKGASAVKFFRRTGLDDSSLAKVWDRSVPPFNEGMTRQQLDCALKIVALLQSGQELTIQSASAAIAVPTPVMFPRIAPAPLNIPPQEDLPEAHSSPSSSPSTPASLSGSDMPISSASSVPAPQWLVTELGPSSSTPASGQFFTHAETGDDGVVPPSSSAPFFGNSDAGEEISGDFGEEDIARETFSLCSTCIVHVELRLAPLHAKESAKLARIAAVKDSLMAYPSLSGGMLQWVGVGDSLGHLKQARREHTEDPDSAPCVEIPCDKDTKITSHALDCASDFLWLGHENGTVSLWHVDGRAQELSAHITTWKAHKSGSVSAMVATQWGQLWTGSSRGSLRVCSQATSGTGPIRPSRTLRRHHGDKAHGEVKSIILSTDGSIVWTAGHSNLGLWDAYTGEFLGKIDTDRVDTFGTVANFDDKEKVIDANKGFVGGKRFGARTAADPNELPQDKKIKGGRVGNITRFIGKMSKKAGNQVLRMPAAAVGGTNAHRIGSIQALVAQPGEGGDEGMVWVGYKGGLVEKYSQSGRILGNRWFQQPVACLCAVGDRMWVAFRDGTITILGSDVNREMFRWPAHESRVCSMVMMGSTVYTLAADGAIRCWSREIPNPMAEAEAWKRWKASMAEAINLHSVRVLCGSWNVNEMRPEKKSLQDWLGGRHKAGRADIIIVGLQEVEMGTGSVARSVAIDFISKSSLQEKGNSNAQWWANELLDALKLDCEEEDCWSRVAMRQMSGVFVIVFARRKLMPYLGNVATASVACGVGGFGRNKGAVAVAFTLHRRRLVALSSHFAAHQEAVKKRNANYRDIVKNINFYKGDSEQGAAGATSLNAPSELDDHEEPALGMGYQRAECVVWVGDFNYRLDEASRSDTVKKIEQAIEQGGDYRDLLANDQCRKEMRKRKLFHGLREGSIDFQPTYKFDKNKNEPLAYDSSDKQRVPAWTDRIFFRGSKPFEGIGGDEGQDEGHTDGHNQHNDREAVDSEEPDQIVVRSEAYEACMDVNGSDHKPIWCLLAIDFPVYNQERKRAQCFTVLKEAAGEQVQVPVRLACPRFSMVHGDVHMLDVENHGDCACLLTVMGKDPPHVIPIWLEVKPLRMIVQAREKGTFQLTSCRTRGSSSTNLSTALMVQAESLFCGWGTSPTQHRFKVHLKQPTDPAVQAW